jgi:hypothetical protein
MTPRMRVDDTEDDKPIRYANERDCCNYRAYDETWTYFSR